MNSLRVLTVATLVFSATHALAIDMTGLWFDDAMRCKVIASDGSKSGAVGSNPAFSITHAAGDRLRMTASITVPCPATAGGAAAGWVVQNATDPNRGEALATACSTSGTNTFSAQLSKVKTYAVANDGTSGSAKATITMVAGGGACVASCKGVVRRVTTNDPVVADCP